MYEVLHRHLLSTVPFTPDELARIDRYFQPHQLRRRERLLEAGQVSRQVAFVEKGALYSSSPDEKGHQQVLQFALEGWWIGDFYSQLTGEPSIYTIEALEDSDVLLLDAVAAESLYDEVPRFERHQRLLLQRNYVATHRRLLHSLSRSAEEKYDDLLARYPAIGQRVPQHLVASYLGITPEFLSRIRARKASRS